MGAIDRHVDCLPRLERVERGSAVFMVTVVMLFDAKWTWPVS